MDTNSLKLHAMTADSSTLQGTGKRTQGDLDGTERRIISYDCRSISTGVSLVQLHQESEVRGRQGYVRATTNEKNE